METKHTPGPWSILSEQGAVGPRGDEWKMTASVYGDHPECEPDERMAANARLIAAAPDLLEALRWYVENDDTNIGMEGNEFWEEGLERGKAALAKATGEQA